MSQKTLFGILGLVALVIGASQLITALKGPQQIVLPSGADIDAAGGLSSANLLAILNDFAEDVNAVRVPLSNVSSTSVSLDWPPIASGSSTATSTTLVGATAGDFVLISPASSGISLGFSGHVSTTDLITIVATAADVDGNTEIDVGDSLFYIRLIPQATFARPGALQITTSTAF